MSALARSFGPHKGNRGSANFRGIELSQRVESVKYEDRREQHRKRQILKRPLQKKWTPKKFESEKNPHAFVPFAFVLIHVCDFGPLTVGRYDKGQKNGGFQFSLQLD